MDKNNHLMTRIARWIVDRRRLILVIFAALALLSVYTSTLVVTNDSLEHFLPSDTETRLGLDIMDREFVTYDTAQIVVRNISLEQAESIAARAAIHRILLPIESQSIDYKSLRYAFLAGPPNKNRGRRFRLSR